MNKLITLLLVSQRLLKLKRTLFHYHLLLGSELLLLVLYWNQ